MQKSNFKMQIEKFCGMTLRYDILFHFEFCTLHFALKISPVRLYRYPHREPRPLPGPAHDIDPAAVVLDDTVGDRQAEPGAVLLGGKKGAEELLPVLLGDADAGVGDRHLDRAALNAALHRQ